MTLRTPVGSPGARLLGLGAHRPARVMNNDEAAAHADTTDAWIRERSGIVTRHIAAPDETTVDMAVEAGAKALAASGVCADAIDLVLLATSTHPYQTPGGSAELATRLGTRSPGATDVGAGCAGFGYALSFAADAIRVGSARHVLVVGSEKLTDYVDVTDRSICFIFGDGAGAAVVGPSGTAGIGPVVWGSDGERKDAITQTRTWVDFSANPTGGRPWLTMDGPGVFRWAVTSLAPVAVQACALAGIEPADLVAFVPHQANLRIIDAIAKGMGLPADVAIARDVVDTGNTSAASVPLALSTLLERGEVRSGDPALLFGFGAGLAYAGQVVLVP